MQHFERVKLSQLIFQNTKAEKIVDMQNEHYITLSLYGKGAHERIIKDGKYPVPFIGYRVSAGQFIYSRIDARNGAYDIIPPELEGYVVSKDFPIYDINTQKILPWFLLRSVLSDSFIKQVKSSSFGATNRMRIKEEVLENYTISLPPIELQAEIADRLNLVEHIISEREHELTLLNDLTKARFVEMFGDMADPDCKWPICRLIEACDESDDIKCGPFGTQLSKDEYQESGIPVWEIPQINSAFAIAPEHFLTIEKATQLRAYSLSVGDIVMSRKGNVGKCAIFPADKPDGILHSDVLRIRVSSKKTNPCFMMCQLHFSRDIIRQIEMVSSGAIMAGVNVTKLKDIMVKMPPLDLQNQFAVFVSQVDKSKVAVQKALDEAQILFDSLMQQYFG